MSGDQNDIRSPFSTNFPSRQTTVLCSDCDYDGDGNTNLLARARAHLCVLCARAGVRETRRKANTNLIALAMIARYFYRWIWNGVSRHSAAVRGAHHTLTCEWLQMEFSSFQFSKCCAPLAAERQNRFCSFCSSSVLVVVAVVEHVRKRSRGECVRARANTHTTPKTKGKRLPN